MNPLVSFFGRLVARSGRISDTGQTDGRMVTVTLAAHARRGFAQCACAQFQHFQVQRSVEAESSQQDREEARLSRGNARGIVALLNRIEHGMLYTHSR